MRKGLIVSTALVALMLMACASTPSEQPIDSMQAGLLLGVGVQESAVAAYEAVFTAYQKGAVTDEQLGQARELYADYLLAHAAYKASLKAYDILRDEVSLLSAEGAVLDAVVALIECAEALGVFE